MNKFMYHGITISEETCHIPYSYLIDRINTIVNQLREETAVKSALSSKKELFSIYRNNSAAIITHIYNGQISFSKIEKGELSDITDEDILDLADHTRLFSLSRFANRHASAFQRGELSAENIIGKRFQTLIKAKDSQKDNYQFTLDLSLIQNKQLIKTHHELTDVLDDYTQIHGTKNINNILRRRISQTQTKEQRLKDIDFEFDFPDNQEDCENSSSDNTDDEFLSK